MRIWIVNVFFILLIVGFYVSCKPENKGDNLNAIIDLKTKQYAIAGRELYLIHCANCHQVDGSGLGLVIPPLKGADYLKVDIARSVHIIRYGQKGEIIVNGATYNQPMPANPNLKPIEIAQIATYIHTLWGDGEQLISIDSVNVYLK
ncbi:c-type cytochrome [Lunatibacter salilacus]|uniref:c-type cytochrome n=1 Tax=Lunatibacter salilacus TaxID=2483804 RepID=UPI00131AEFD8|nr:cytochrome c [Lunatibacter salilacus]